MSESSLYDLVVGDRVVVWRYGPTISAVEKSAKHIVTVDGKEYWRGDGVPLDPESSPIRISVLTPRIEQEIARRTHDEEALRLAVELRDYPFIHNNAATLSVDTMLEMLDAIGREQLVNEAKGLGITYPVYDEIANNYDTHGG
jgi:hypothetical protein